MGDTEARVLPSSMSLVKYDNPVLVTRHGDEIGAGAAGKKAEKKTPGSPRVPPGPPVPGEVTAPGGHSKLQTGSGKKETEEILNTILPPREWEEEGHLWQQHVSSTPATRLDVINLQEQLDMKLQQRQARETGICPIRRELYAQCFDEIIRQVTINCSERGLLLLRVRDEIKMTLTAYQTLYESSTAFGMRKALMAEQGKTDLEGKIEDLEEQKVEYERQLAELRMKVEQVERRANEQRQAEEKKHTEEIQFLKRANQQLKTQLEGIIAPKSK